MCSVSMIADHYHDKWVDRPWFPPNEYPWNPTWPSPMDPSVKDMEIAQLREEIEELKKLLKRARQYDIDNDQPDCEIAEKMDHLEKVAKLAGFESLEG